MEPEEIDKLFRDKLAGKPALPSPEAWMRLQQQMEPKKKEKTMWIYYAAASVVLLLMAGLLYFRAGQQGPGPAIATAPASQAPVSEIPKAEQGQLAATSPAQFESAPEAIPGRERHRQQPPIRVATGSKPKHQPVKPRFTPAEAPVQLASNKQEQENRQQEPAPVLAVLPASPPAAPDLSIVEVKVQRNPDADQEPGLRDNLSRKGQLLKNIYKQARNLKNGEPVELAALGVNEGRLQEESKELKQKISNVISL